MPLPAIAFRPVTAADTPFLAEVYRTSRWEELAPTGWTDAQKRAFLLQQFHAQTTDWDRSLPHAKREIILVDRAPAGRLYVDRRPAAREIRVVEISLLPAARGRGIGSRLFAALIAEADGAGHKLSLHVEHRNPARRLYDRLGFAPVRDAGAYLLMERAPQTAAAR